MKKGSYRRRRLRPARMVVILCSFVVVLIYTTFTKQMFEEQNAWLEQATPTRSVLVDRSQLEPNRASLAAVRTRQQQSIGSQETINIDDTRIETIAFNSFDKNPFCNQLARRFAAMNGTPARSLLPAQPKMPTLVNITVGCQNLFARNVLGTGNYLTVLYGIRLAARTIGNVNVLLSCEDAEQHKSDLILPWIMGWFPSQPAEGTALKKPTKQQSCGTFHTTPIQYMVDDMRYELRRMAVSLVGVPHPSHPSSVFAENVRQRDEKIGSFVEHGLLQVNTPQFDTPIFPGVELDDAVLHFRCGDLLTVPHKKYGFLKFSAFSKVISPEARTIGIVTQPFKGQKRGRDMQPQNERRCRAVVNALVSFLGKKFPAAKISLRNDPTENIALSYARMIMANQTIAGVSTFPLFPALTTFGTGYIRKPRDASAPLGWLVAPPVDQVGENVVLMDEPELLTSEKLTSVWVGASGRDKILKWFQDDDEKI